MIRVFMRDGKIVEIPKVKYGQFVKIDEMQVKNDEYNNMIVARFNTIDVAGFVYELDQPNVTT